MVVEHPVFQFNYDISNDGIVSFKFSSETESISPPVFAIPILESNPGYSISLQYYFPCERNGEYLELTVKNHNGFLKVDDKNYPIKFALMNNYIPFQTLYPNHGPLKYTGKNNDLIKPYRAFLPLIPLDIMLMDQLALELSLFFVGLTPNFGKQRELEIR